MVFCEQCGLSVKRRVRCYICKTRIGHCCNVGRKVCAECYRKVLLRDYAGKRRNDSKHDAEIFALGGIKMYGRLIRGGEPVREYCSHRGARNGVNADFVDSQYHGRESN